MSLLYTTCTDYLEAIKREFVLDTAATPYTIWPNSDRIGSINEGRNILAAELLCLPTTNTITTIAGTVAYDLSTRSSRLVYVEEVWYATHKVFRTSSFGDIIPGASSGTPYVYYIDAQNKYIHFQPPPSTAKTVTCRTYVLPAEFTAGGDSETLPQPVRDLVVSYALAKGFERDGIADGVNRSNYYKQEFQEGIKRAKRWKRVI